MKTAMEKSNFLSIFVQTYWLICKDIISDKHVPEGLACDIYNHYCYYILSHPCNIQLKRKGTKNYLPRCVSLKCITKIESGAT